ncbi:trichohyalin-like isoform X2 [Corythoichthys intestinalis]|uniref:trichohyalin-like isoform X2 n=1 Tax=Corythoichthys intestinalis TaxID=161448 RepID=UPI0025A5E08A|nr:trichohyalin-like isoform X2 [Corythoichthys intestinalis]
MKSESKNILSHSDTSATWCVQVELPDTSLNLQDIYKAWLKLHSLGQPDAQSSKGFDGVEPDECADQSPRGNNKVDDQATFALKPECTDAQHTQNGRHSTQPEEQEPKVVMDSADVKGEASEKVNVNQTEAAPKAKEPANDCLDEEARSSRICLKDRERFNAIKKVTEAEAPPLADADVSSEPVKEETLKMDTSDIEAQLEQQDYQKGAPEVPADDKMAAEERDHLNVDITLNIDVCKNNEKDMTPKKKKKEKTKTDPEEAQKAELDRPPENKKKAKKRKEEEDWQQVEESVNEKKKTKRRKKDEEGLKKDQELQFEEGATQVQKKTEPQGDPNPQLSSRKYRKNVKRRQRKKRAERLKQQQLATMEEQTLPPQPFQRDRDDAILEEDAPKMMMNTKEETPSEENLPPINTTRKKDKKKKKTAANVEAVENDINPLEDVKKKKRKGFADGEQVEEVAANGGNANQSLEEVDKKMESGHGDETPVTSDSSAKKKKKKKVKNKMGEDGDA